MEISLSPLDRHNLHIISVRPHRRSALKQFAHASSSARSIRNYIHTVFLLALAFRSRATTKFTLLPQYIASECLVAEFGKHPASLCEALFCSFRSNMSSLTLPPPCGLPASPRANRQMALLSPLDTSFSASNRAATLSSLPASPYSGSTEASSPTSTLVETRHRNRDSLIFINATIPLSPASSTTSSSSNSRQGKEGSPYEGLVPRKRSGFARLFSCLGREERARRRIQRDTEFVRVGESCHWTEY